MLLKICLCHEITQPEPTLELIPMVLVEMHFYRKFLVHNCNRNIFYPSEIVVGTLVPE
jgi:hypothetical protein